MSAAVLDTSRPVVPIDLKIAGSPATTPVHTPETALMSAEPVKMKKPAKMKKAPRRVSVALAQASPSMLDSLDEAGTAQAVKPFQSYDAASAPITPRAMKKPVKKGTRRASLMPGQQPTGADGSTDFQPSLAPIPASGLAAEPAADVLGQTPAKPSPKPKGGNLKGKGAKRSSVANLGADPAMLAAMAEEGIEMGAVSEEDDGATAAPAGAPAAAAATAAAAAPAPASAATPAADEQEVVDDV